MKRLALFILLLLLLAACTPASAAPTSTPVPPTNTPTDVPSPEPTHTPQATVPSTPDSDNGNKENVFDISITKITNNTAQDWDPQVSDDYVVWYGYEDGDAEIYLYQISSGITTQVSNNMSDD